MMNEKQQEAFDAIEDAHIAYLCRVEWCYFLGLLGPCRVSRWFHSLN